MILSSDSITEYLSSPAGLNTVVLVIVLFGAINSIFIAYAVRNSFGKIKDEEKKRKMQEAKINRLFPPKPYSKNLNKRFEED
ncbi:hypothetical protein [Prochlorococcus sp. MIT 1223]|uniref:hypothetical protein n=1 Tax=Prochlorococcus sp. MIT 1223 TaxID=3096217 RepID=UPI002A7500DD|nr:hypothetical protein [Prochlorococcus sp. MIT 1223]